MTPDQLHATVAALMEAGRHEEGLALLEANATLQKLDWRLLFDAGMILLNLDRPEEAAPRFELAHRLEPGTSSLLFWAGHALARAGQLVDAERVLIRSLELKDDWWARLTLANVYLETDRPDDAEAVHLEGLGLEPDSKERHQNYALFLLDIEEDELARQHYDKALGLPFESVEARLAHAALLAEAPPALRALLADAPAIEGVEVDWAQGPFSVNPDDDNDDNFMFNAEGFRLGGERRTPDGWTCAEGLTPEGLLAHCADRAATWDAPIYWLSATSRIAFLIEPDAARAHLGEFITFAEGGMIWVTADATRGLIIDLGDDGFQVGSW